MDFSDALRAVKEGKHVRRAMWKEAWPVPGAGLMLKVVHTVSGETFTMLLCEYPAGQVWPFPGAHWDLLAEDWEEVT